MKIRSAALAALVVLATAVAPSSAAAADSVAKQRVEITAKGVANPSSSAKFVLTPLSPGRLAPDSGIEASVVANQRSVTRDGQAAEIVTWVTTCTGKRGSFVLRVRIEHVEAGNGFHIGTGTWKFVRGTGVYAGIAGGGRVANAWVDRGSRALSERRDGFLTAA